MVRCYILLSFLIVLSSCQPLTVYSPAEHESGYTYVPLDPFPVKAVPGKGCANGVELNRGTLLQALPDNAVRMLIEQIDAKGKVSYGPSQVLGHGASYRVTIDYIYSDTKNQSIFVSKSVLRVPEEFSRSKSVFLTTNVSGGPEPELRTITHSEVRQVVPINSSPTFSYVRGSEEYKVTLKRPSLGPPANYVGVWSEEEGLARRNQTFAVALRDYRSILENLLESIKHMGDTDFRLKQGIQSDSDKAKAEQELKWVKEQIETLAQARSAAEKKLTEARDIAYREFKNELERFDKEYTEFNIPIYVGLGLRTASIIYAVKGEANISGLGVIGAEAEANNLKGSLIIQTLGVNGKSVAAALPIQSELNRTTAQNAIVAIGTIKALLHSPETWIAPRVVGLYLPFPGGKALMNALVSELSTQELVWEFSCPSSELVKPSPP